MAYIIEGPGPSKSNPRWTIDLWRDYRNSETLFEWYERDTKESRDRLIDMLLGHGHKFPPDLDGTEWTEE